MCSCGGAAGGGRGRVLWRLLFASTEHSCSQSLAAGEQQRLRVAWMRTLSGLCSSVSAQSHATCVVKCSRCAQFVSYFTATAGIGIFRPPLIHT